MGWARRNILVPVPYAPDLSGLNTLLLERCTKYEAHQIKGKPAKVGAMMDEERPMFHPLPGYRFETAKSVNVRVNAFSTARFRTNSYSVPVQYTGRMVGIKGHPETVEIYYKGLLIAVHTRCYGKHQSIYHLEHYMPLLEELDLTRYSGSINEIFINELASCKFIKECRNIKMLGNPGRGKTHMAIGLGLKACSMGMSILFKNAYSLSTELSEARDDYSLGKLEKRIQKADLLILDEMGYVSFDRYQSELLFKIIADRSERGSIIVTTNLPFSE